MKRASDRVRRRLDPDERYGLRVTLLALALLLVAVPFGILLREVTQHGSLTRVDTSAARGLHTEILRHPAAVTAMKVVSFFGSTLWLAVLICAVAALLAWRRLVRLAVFVAATAATGAVLNNVVKSLVDRPRPSLVDPVATAHGQSFPSGHAMGSTICYGVILLVVLPLLARRHRPIAVGAWIAVVAAIGFSRLALGVHYITDVVGGVVLGLAWVSASVAAFQVWRVERGGRKTSVLREGVQPEAAAQLPHETNGAGAASDRLGS
jgi:undecaprenyl-diphosphatase